MIGSVISHYEIVEKLGEGGMGVVYKARDTHLDRFVAIKVLPPETVADPERVRRFIQEAKAASSLNHAHIVVIHDIAEVDGVHFIAMEYVPGRPLDQLIKGLRLNQALRYAIQIADALSAAHSAGIVHRDIKPGNIVVSDDGRVKVLDFGLAKLTAPADSDGDALTGTLQPETSENVILGTVSYMSPEQAEGRKVDARSDIFSFGSVLYEMVTGQQPFRKETRMSTISAILQQEPRPPAEIVEGVPRDLERIIARCLRKDVERRFQSMADVRVELKELSEESESGTTIKPVPLRPRRWKWIAGVVAVLALAAASYSVWLLRPRTISAPGNSPSSFPLTSYPGLEFSPSFSPDGSQVAFCWNGEQQDNFDIYVKLIGPGTPLRLTRSPARDDGPAWSPDGRWIAFRRVVGGGKVALFVIPALGGPERKLLEVASSQFFGESVSWHPEGNWLAFADRDSPEARAGLFAVSITSGQKRRLTSPPASSDGDVNPAFSPDGRTLAFCRSVTLGGGHLFLLPLSTAAEPEGEPERLTFEHLDTSTPAWTPDGREIIYNVRAQDSFNLWRLRLSHSRAPQGKPERLALVGQGGFEPALSRQGHRLAYTRPWRDLNIWRVQIPEGIPAPFISSSRGEENPKFSPDGTKIAFRSDRSGYNEVWVSESDGSNASQLTSFGGPMNSDPNWSPDGRRIAFKSTAHGHGDIYVINADGGRSERLTTEPSDDLMPAWSHDGRWIYFASNRSGTDEVWKMPASGGAAVQVTKQGGFYSQESPDGRFLYYGKGRDPDTSVWRMPVAGGEETRVLESITGWMNFVVRDDGIYFMPAGAQPSIQFLRFATGRMEPVLTIGKPPAAGLTVSPDGRIVLFTVYEQSGSDLMLVENFR